MCKTLCVSSSGYYAWRRRPLSRRAKVDQVLQRRIKAIHAESRGIYGSPKIHALLQQEGLNCSRKRVIRLMRQADLRAKRQRCFKRTTQRDPAHSAAPNRLKQNFVATQPNQVWLADITYIRTAEGWLYLAAVMDLYSRRILGWAMNSRMSDMLTQRALTMALERRPIKPQQLIHHSDRGTQYTSGSYQELLGRHQVQVSMSGTGNCYDNAPMESFFSLLKTELVYHERYATRQAARTSLFDYIEVFYNRQRIHGSTDYLSPAAYEARWLHSSSQKGNSTVLLSTKQSVMS
jgi:putative transposase